MSLSKLYDVDNLYKALKAVTKASGWKESTQRYKANFLSNLIDLSERLKSGKWQPTKPRMFKTIERGKTRIIESYSIEDRIVQGCFIKEILLPQIRPYIIYDNSASLKGRGTSHFRNRFELKLCRFAKKYGENGYILTGDFTKYFDNIIHENFYEFLRKCKCDEDVIDFTKLLLKDHIISVEDDSKPFNSVLYYYGENHGNIRLEKSIGVGSPLAQIGGVCGAYKIDNFISKVLGLEYGRYMDDFYVLSQSKEVLILVKELLIEKTKEEGLYLNPTKTQITPLSHEFVMLQTIYRIKNHTLIKRPNKQTFIREKRKLKKLSPKITSGEMTEDAYTCRHLGWQGDIEKRFINNKSLNNIKLIYKEELDYVHNHT